MTIVAVLFLVAAIAFYVASQVLRDEDAEIPLLFVGLGLAVVSLLVFLGSAAEMPECEQVYNPDGSYVETCEYQGDE